MPRVVRPAFVLLALLPGCGPGGPELAPVSCTVTLNGKPLDQIEVKFLLETSREQPRGLDSVGVSNAQGVVELVASDGRKGVMVGKHRVVLRDLRTAGDQFIGRRGDDSDEKPRKKKPSRIPELLADPA